MKTPCIHPIVSKKDIDAFIAEHAGVVHNEKNDSLEETFSFKEREETELFVGLVLWLSHALWHHPRIDVQWRKVTLSLRTHDSHGITKKDLEFFSTLHELLRVATLKESRDDWRT